MAAPQGILVIIENATGSESARLMTDSRGKFEVSGLPPAPYRVRVHQSGFFETSASIDLSYGPSGTVDLELRPLPSRDPAAAGLPPGGPASVLDASVPQSDKGRKEFEAGQKMLFEDKDAAGSVEHFKKLVKAEPKFVAGHLLLGTALMNSEQYSDAEAAFRDAIKVDSKSYAANFELGACLNQEGKFADAEAPLLASLQIRPAGLEGHYELSRTYLALNRWQDAEPHAKQALKINPKFAPAHVILGNIYLKKREPMSALQEFEQYLAIEPSGAFAAQTQQVADKLRTAMANGHQ